VASYRPKYRDPKTGERVNLEVSAWEAASGRCH
jgi:hypothetical protein